MSAVVTEPLTIGQVLDRGFQLFKQSIPVVWPLTLLAALLSGLPALLLAPHKAANGTVDAHFGAMFGTMALSLLFTFTVYIGLIRKIDDIAENRNALPLSEAYFGGFKFLLRYIAASFLFGFVMMLGFVLLLIPGFILMLSLSFYPYYVILERASPADSLRNSHKLVWGHWWRWSAIFTVSVMLFAAVYAVLGVGATLLGHAVGGADSKFAGLIGSFCAQVVVTTIATPLLYSIQLIGFRDLQLRKGGADLAERIAQAA
jgi:hypothetical protein